MRYAAWFAGFALLCSSSARAATTITVNSTAQEATAANPTGTTNGNCTLGEAILAANAGTTVDGCTVGGGSSPFTIVLSQTTYTLTTAHNYWYGPNALPPIATTIVIDGNGAVLQATDPTRLRFFFVGAPAGGEFFTPGPGNLTLRNITLTGGRQQGGMGTFAAGSGAGMGGAIFNQGTLSLDSVTMNGNRATGGSSVNGVAVANGAGGGMGQDAPAPPDWQGYIGGGFGGAVGGSTGGAGVDTTGAGGGGGGFKATDNGGNASVMSGGPGGGTADGLGGAGSPLKGPGGAAGHGSGGGAGGDGTTGGPGAQGGDFGQGGGSIEQSGGGGGVGGGGGSGGGGGGFGGGGGSFGGSGGFGGGGAMPGGVPGFGGGTGSDSNLLGGGGAGMGGAIFNQGGTVTLLNATLTDNTATGGAGDGSSGNGKGYGGAIFNLNGTVLVRFSTLASNVGTDGGGAIYNLGYNLQSGITATLTIESSLLVNSTDGSAATTDTVTNHPATVASGAANNATATVTILAGLLGTTSEIGPLANNGGLTKTMAITTASPAFNAVSCGNTTVDQRGVVRPQGLKCDLGAYELLQAPIVTQNPAPQTVCAGTQATFTAAATGASSVQWQVSVGGGAFSDISGANTTTLNIATTAGMNGNRYQAVFTNALTSVTTTPALLTVNTAPVVSAISGDTAVLIGQTVTFTASATGTAPISVQWQVSPDGIVWTNIPGATSTTLTFVATAATIGNHYNAVFTNTCGVASADPVVLTLLTSAAASRTGAYQVRYLANLNVADSYVNISNVGTVNGNDPAGQLCANIYVFDPNEEPVSCCACPVTPNGLVRLSARDSLVRNPLTFNNPTAAVVKILFTAKTAGDACDAGGLPVPVATTLARGGAAWAWTPHQNTSNNRYELTETEFARSDLSISEYQKLAAVCRFIQTYASGFGLCKGCQTGAMGAAKQ